MKEITVSLTIFITLLWNVSNSQNLIAVQNGGTPLFYTYLDSAIVHAVNGDTIFIPGGVYPHNPNIQITKQIHLIGVGHNPDSTIATYRTELTNGHILLNTGAGGGSITGIYTNNTIVFNNYISNYTVSRCYAGLNLNAITVSNNIFIENVIVGLTCNHAPSCVFYNNIIVGGADNLGENTVFKNNIFLTSWYLLYGNNQNSIFENNIIISPAVFMFSNYSGTYNVFNNNLFLQDISFPYVVSNCTNVGINNIANQPQSSIFINQSGNAFSYFHDYHLKGSSPGKNAGKDGTDIGIYGGSSPWKDGSVPANPHLQSKFISNTTNQSGNLNVNIKVAAQDR